MGYLFAPSKLRIPPLPPRYLLRPALVRSVDEAVENPLTLLSAGPGSGKTVLLTAWARSTDASVIWLSLDVADNSVDTFWPLVLHALAVNGVVPPDRLIDISSSGEVVEAAAALAAAALNAAEEPTVLILDDAHLLTDRQLLTGIDGLIRGQIPHFRLIMSSRRDPLLPLHRYRLDGIINEIRAADLALSYDDVKALLAAHGVQLSRTQLAVLHRRTEGWMAGVRLSALRMENSSSPADFVSQFALDPGSTGDYLLQEVLNGTTKSVRRLLIGTSMLDEVCGELADAIVGGSSGHQILTQLARANSFVVPIDPEETWFRYHPLFSELLRYLLRHESGQAPRDMTIRAAHWYGSKGDYLTALRYALDAGDTNTVVWLLFQGAFVQSFCGRVSLPIDRLYEVVSLSDAKYPLVSAALAAQGGSEISEDVVSGVFDDSHGASTDMRERQATLLIRFQVSRARHDTKLIEESAAHLLETLDPTVPADRDVKVQSLLSLGVERIAAGHLDRAREALDLALDLSAQDEQGYARVECLGLLAILHAWRGQLTKARQMVVDARYLIRHDPEIASVWTLPLHVAAGLIALHEGNIATATKEMRLATATNRTWDDVAIRQIADLVQASIDMLAGRASHAQVHLGSYIDSDRRDALSALRIIAAAEVETALGRPRSALKRLNNVAARDKLPEWALARARAQLAMGDTDEAHRSLVTVIAGGNTPPSTAILVSAMLLSAVVSDREGDEADAVAAVVRAIEMAESGLRRPFIESTSQLAILLARHPDVAKYWPGALAPQSSEGVPTSPARPLPLAARAEPLTQREATVLRWLATSMSTAEIADAMCVSTNTVKTHIAAIYRKLGVGRRREAVSRARESGLL